MSNPPNELVLTSDGSPTLLSGVFSETYHSLHGAVSESKHVFIKNGLEYLFDLGLTHVSILEHGFGTGLNALLSYQYAKLHSLPIDFNSIELYPVSSEDISSLNFDIDLLGSKTILDLLHKVPWESEQEIASNFKLTKYKVSFEDFTSSKKFDLIYHDAFAPSTQEKYWLAPFLKQCYDWLNPQGILVSYCAKGSFKRALKEVGFIVESLPGAPGKREMTRARKI